jgi:hypothetical protein
MQDMGIIYVKPRKRPQMKAIIPAEDVETIISPVKLPVKKRSGAKKGKKVISKGRNFDDSNESQEAGPSTSKPKPKHQRSRRMMTSDEGSSQTAPPRPSPKDQFLMSLVDLLPLFMQNPLPKDQLDKGLRELSYYRETPETGDYMNIPDQKVSPAIPMMFIGSSS